MRKILSLVVSFALLFTLISPITTSANSSTPNSITEQIGDFTVTTTEYGNIRKVHSTNGEETHEATFNLLTKELILDGELVPQDVVESFQDLTQVYSQVSTDQITPLQNEQGDLGGYKLVLDFGIPLSLGNWASYTVGVFITIIGSIVGANLSESLKAGLAGFLFSEWTLSKLPSMYVNVKVYSVNLAWGPWRCNIYFYKDSSRQDLIHMLYDSTIMG